MASWDGFYTWLEWEFLFVKLFLVAAVLVWGARVLLDATPLSQIGISHVLVAWGLLTAAAFGLTLWFGRDE